MTFRLLMIASALITPRLFGQAGDSITFGGNRFKLGMSKDQVVTQLVTSFDVAGPSGRTSPCESTCTIWEKAAGPPYTMVGSVAFRDGKLSSATKYWDPVDQQKAAPFARSVYGVIAELVKDGKTTCTIQTGQSESPGNEQKAAFIICGDRKIEILVMRDDKLGEIGTVSELLTK